MTNSARIVAPLAVGLLILIVWEAIVRINAIPPYILPGPILVAETLWRDGPSLLGSLLVTLRVVFVALAAAVILGGAIRRGRSRRRRARCASSPRGGAEAARVPRRRCARGAAP